MTTQTTNIINRDSDPANFDNLWIVRESKVVLGVELLRRQKKRLLKRRLVQAPQASFKAPIHSECCIGGFKETDLALVIVLRCE